MVDVDGSSLPGRLTGQVSWLTWLGLRVGNHLALSLHSSNEPSELSQWPYHNNSTITIVNGISTESYAPHSRQIIL